MSIYGWSRPAGPGNVGRMTEIRPSGIDSDKKPETAAAPMFRRYQIKVKAGVRVGAVPTGRPPIGY